MKSILVTGATDGIGRETARQLLEEGHRVLIHGRTLEKATRVAGQLQSARQTGRAEPVFGDLAEAQQVVALARQATALTPRLDVLVNNAGVFEPERQLTRDGFELTMAVNHFATFLLTQRLLDALRSAPKARVVTVSSMAHQSGRLDLKDLSFARGYDGYAAYSASKLANILFTVALAKRLTGTAITANCLHPGVISTKLLRRGFGMGGASVAEGARTCVYLATSDEVEHVTGDYFVDCHVARASSSARDSELAEALWRETERLLRPFLA